MKPRTKRAGATPIRARQVAINGGVVVVIDDQGRAWERREDMQIGEWGLVPLPSAPPRKQKK